MAMLTLRNNLPVKLNPIDAPMLDEIDAVYEILDAELLSNKEIHDRAMAAIKSNQKPQEALAVIFEREVYAVAKREGLMQGVPAENFNVIARQLAKDWDDSSGRDYRREAAQGAMEP